MQEHKNININHTTNLDVYHIWKYTNRSKKRYRDIKKYPNLSDKDAGSGIKAEYKQLFGLMKCNMFVGTTSGPGHIAPMLGIKTILLNSTILMPSMPMTDNCLVSLMAFSFREEQRDPMIILKDWGKLIEQKILQIRRLEDKEVEEDLRDFDKFRNLKNANEWPYTLTSISKTIRNFEVYGEVYFTKINSESGQRVGRTEQ